MGKITGVARLFLVLVNITFLLIGIGFMVFGMFLRFGSSYYDDEIQKVKDDLEKSATDSGLGTLNLDDFDIAELLMSISIGIFMFGFLVGVVSLLGCLGGCCGWKKFLIGYVVICLVLLAAQVVAVGIVYGSPDTVHEPTKDQLKSDIKSDYAGLVAADIISAGWNIIMQQLKCCGVDSYNDFTGATNWDSSTYSLLTPLACCRTLPTSNDLTCATTPTDTINYMNTGCYDTIWDMTLGHSTVGIVCGCVGLFQLLLIAFGIFVICTHDDKKTDTVRDNADELPKKKKRPASALDKF